VIRLAIPSLTEERRKDLAKIVKKRSEEKKVAVRQVRREANDMLKSLEKEKEITEDERRQGQDQVQKITDKFINNIDELTAKKEEEILEI
jgi:ribosome recycling factor